MGTQLSIDTLDFLEESGNVRDQERRRTGDGKGKGVQHPYLHCRTGSRRRRSALHCYSVRFDALSRQIDLDLTHLKREVRALYFPVSNLSLNALYVRVPFYFPEFVAESSSFIYTSPGSCRPNTHWTQRRARPLRNVCAQQQQLPSSKERTAQTLIDSAPCTTGHHQKLFVTNSPLSSNYLATDSKPVNFCRLLSFSITPSSGSKTSFSLVTTMQTRVSGTKPIPQVEEWLVAATTTQHKPTFLVNIQSKSSDSPGVKSLISKQEGWTEVMNTSLVSTSSWRSFRTCVTSLERTKEMQEILKMRYARLVLLNILSTTIILSCKRHLVSRMRSKTTIRKRL